MLPFSRKLHKHFAHDSLECLAFISLAYMYFLVLSKTLALADKKYLINFKTSTLLYNFKSYSGNQNFNGNYQTLKVENRS